MRGVADEERAHLLDELARLPRLAHRLHQVRQRVKVPPDQADDELVVARVEPVAREADVVRQLLRAVRHPELRVLDVIRPYNEQLKLAVSGGVTTICFIPGSLPMRPRFWPSPPIICFMNRNFCTSSFTCWSGWPEPLATRWTRDGSRMRA